MMFSSEKCAGPGNGAQTQSGVFAGGQEKESAATDDVASAVAAVSDEIGDILKDELADDKEDRVGVQLADLALNLGILAGLGDGDENPDFLTSAMYDIPMSRHESLSSLSTSSTWSGQRSLSWWPRPRRSTRSRAITKGKELSRTRRVGRRATEARPVVSDMSDVGAESDSDDQWTELDEPCSSDSSSLKGVCVANNGGCNGYEDKQDAVAPPMGQFLLPLLSDETELSTISDHINIRHEEILRLLASTEEVDCASFPSNVNGDGQRHPEEMETDVKPQPQCAEPVSLEEEAALLHYICEKGPSDESHQWSACADWLLKIFHRWCENCALVYTMMRTAVMTCESPTNECYADEKDFDWLYRATFSCHCRLCVNAVLAPIHMFIRDLLAALANGERTMRDAIMLMRALKLREAKADLKPNLWELPSPLPISDEGAVIIYEKLEELSRQSEVAKSIVDKVCMCRPEPEPMDKQNAVARFLKVLDNYRQASRTSYKVDILYNDGDEVKLDEAATNRLAFHLAPYQNISTREGFEQLTKRIINCESIGPNTPYQCDCQTPKTLCAAQRQKLFKLSSIELMQSCSNVVTECEEDGKASNTRQGEKSSRKLQHGDGTGAKPPDSVEDDLGLSDDLKGSGSDDSNQDLDDSDDNSLGLSTSSSLDSASEILLAAAAAVESGGSEAETAPGELCRTVRHLMRSIASIERLMDRVLKHCDEWPSSRSDEHDQTRKRVDLGLSEVDRKLMVMYRRLPEVHRKQLQVYHKQKKLSTVCMQLVGGAAPPPPAPGSPPRAPSPPQQAARVLCPEYHLQRFKEVRRKVMHMRDQQLYYHRLRTWLEEQLKQERARSLPGNNEFTLIEDLPGRRRSSNSSPKKSLLTNKRKIRSHVSPSIAKPHKILQMLKHKPHSHSPDRRTDIGSKLKDEGRVEVEAPQAFSYSDNTQDHSDTETIVGENNGDMCKEMKAFLARFANVALNDSNQVRKDLEDEYNMQVDPEDRTNNLESVSPPLQELSPTTVELVPVYTPKPNGRLLAVNRILKRAPNARDNMANNIRTDFESSVIPTPNVIDVDPSNAARTPMLVDNIAEQKEALDITIPAINNMTDNVQNSEVLIDTSGKDPNIYKYVTFGLEIKKAMEECQNIINAYNIKGSDLMMDGHNDFDDQKADDDDIESNDNGNLSGIELCETLVALNPDDEPCEELNGSTVPKLSLEYLSQVLANVAANVPEIATMVAGMPETLKHIKLRFNKSRDNVKVTKNTAKRKNSHKIRTSIDTNLLNVMSFEMDGKADSIRDDLDGPPISKEGLRKFVLGLPCRLIMKKISDYLLQNKYIDIGKYIESNKELFELVEKRSDRGMIFKILMGGLTKEAYSLQDVVKMLKCRFTPWKTLLMAPQSKPIPAEVIDKEIETIVEESYSYIQELTNKYSEDDIDRLMQKTEDLRMKDYGCDNEKLTVTNLNTGNTLDFMKIATVSKDKILYSNEEPKVRYTDLMKQCIESSEISCWIMLDPEIAANVILTLIGIGTKESDNLPDVSSMANDTKIDYFMNRFRDINHLYMMRLPKKSFGDDEWLLILHRLEQWESRVKEVLLKVTQPNTKPAQTQTQSHVSETSEAEILAGKGLSKLISKANSKNVKKPAEPPKPKVEERKVDSKPEKKECCRAEGMVIDASKMPDAIFDARHLARHNALLDKCEAILTATGEKSLIDSFHTIQSYMSQGIPLNERYKHEFISVFSYIDAKITEDEKKHELACKGKLGDDGKPMKHEDFTKIPACCPRMKDNSADHDVKDKSKYKITPCCQAKHDHDNAANSKCCDNRKECRFLRVDPDDPETLARYSAQALRSARQTLRTVALHTGVYNRDNKSDSECCDTPTSDCKWTNDCICFSCKDNTSGSVCLGDTVKQCYDVNDKQSKVILEEKKIPPGKDVKLIPVPPKPQLKPIAKVPLPKMCENTQHQQHICKVGHPGGPCSNEDFHNQAQPHGQDQPCTCCYCTVFGQAPLHTTPVSRNYNETRERLLSILNKKKLKTAANNKEQDIQEQKQPAVQTQEATSPVTQKPQKQTPQPAPAKQAPQNIPMPSAVPAQQAQNQLKPENMESQQNALAEKIAKLIVSDYEEHQGKPPNKNGQSTGPVIVNIPPEPAREEKCVTPKQKVLVPQPKPQQLKPQHPKPEPPQPPARPVMPQVRPPQPQQRPQPPEQCQQQRVSRPQQREESVSSRDTSVFSTSSGCSFISNWRSGCMSDVSRVDDPRDLDTLVQFIEGPARHVDRGKKRVKKQRQKAKKVEAQLVEEREAVWLSLTVCRRAADEMEGMHMAAQYRVKRARAALKNNLTQKTKGKKQNANVGGDDLGEVKDFFNTTAMDLKRAQHKVTAHTCRLMELDKELKETRAVLGICDQKLSPTQGQEAQQRAQMHVQQQKQLLQEQQMHLKEQERARQVPQKLGAAVADLSAEGMVRLRRAGGDAVTVSIPGQAETPLAQLLQNNKKLSGVNVLGDNVPKDGDPRKLEYESALARIHQVANVPKDKKKQKEPPAKPEVNVQKLKPKEPPVPEPQPLSKKQRKLLAKQQAEEEEARRLQQEAKANKKDKKVAAAKAPETSKKEAKKPQEPPKKLETHNSKKTKEDKKEVKAPVKVAEKKGKENKQNKIAPPVNNKQQQPKTPAPQPTVPAAAAAKNKKKPAPQPQVVNNKQPPAQEAINKKGLSNHDPNQLPSCSIMEQLSCGIQVADLKLPPGITLTRVQPNEKKEVPVIKSVPAWKGNSLSAAPTPIARPPPVINADPSMMIFSTPQPEPPKPVIIPEPIPAVNKSKKGKKKSKKASVTTQHAPTSVKKPDGPKMVTLRNPMFHPNLPPVQVNATPQQKVPDNIRIPDPIPMPPNACQATITPTSNGMYTIRNPLMTMMHQQGLMTTNTPQSPQMNPVFPQPTPQYGPSYSNPNNYNPPQQMPQSQTFIVDPSRKSPKIEEREEYQGILNLASFTQKNDEGYSLFKTPEEKPRFLSPETYYVEDSRTFVKPNVSPNPIGTKPVVEPTKKYDFNYGSPFPNSRTDPIGTPMKPKEGNQNDFGMGLYTPFGQEDKFRSALFQNEEDNYQNRYEDSMQNGDLPYFQRLRAGAKLNSEVSIHHVNESKYFKGRGQSPVDITLLKNTEQESIFSRSYPAKSWTPGFVNPSPANSTSSLCSGQFMKSSGSSSVYDSVSNSSSNSPHANIECLKEDNCFGAIGSQNRNEMRQPSFYPETTSSIFAPDRSITNLNELDSSERDIESFKRFDFYFEPPKNKPKINFNVHDIAAQLRPKDK